MTPTVLTFEFDAASPKLAQCFRLLLGNGQIGRLVKCMGFPLSRRTLGIEREQTPLGDHPVDQGKQLLGRIENYTG